MAILDGDIQILKSEVMDDTDQGGGMATGVEVVDGAENAIFPDISELERTTGKVRLRKLFPAVQTSNTDTYFGANVIVSRPPADPKVSATLFTTDSWSDHRPDARDYLESYTALGSASRWVLYGNHLSGQRTVQMHCAENVASPSIDSVLALAQRYDPTKWQYVRVSRVISRDSRVEFEDTRGTYYRDVITIEISSALTMAFQAGTMERYTQNWFSPPTVIYTTVAADAAKYYGVQPLAIAASLGDLSIKAASIYTQLVPSALQETAITDARCAGNRVSIIPISGAPSIAFSTTLTAGAGASVTRYFGGPIAPGSLVVEVDGAEITDDSDGGIVALAGFGGVVDYEVGAVSIARSSAISSLPATFSAAPAGVVSKAAHTDAITISAENRAYTYVRTLSPVPAPRSFSASFMAQGNWYSLWDNGAGQIVGDDGAGTGTINYATGSTQITLGAMPDVDSSLLYSWGSPAHYEAQVGSDKFAPPSVKGAIAGGAVEPGELTMHYQAGGVEKTVTDNGAGNLVGHGTGYIDYATGDFVLRPSSLPDGNSDLSISYKQGGAVSETHVATGATTVITLADIPEPASISLVFKDAIGATYRVTDDGQGNLVVRSANFSALSGEYETHSLASSSGIGGSVHYAGKTITLAAAPVIRTNYMNFGMGTAWATGTATSFASGNIAVKYRAAGDVAGAVQSDSIQIGGISIDILPEVSNSMVPGSWRFTLNGDVYVDRSGSLVKNPSAATNSGVLAGSVNYTSGTITLTDYTGGAGTSFSVSGLTRRGEWLDWRMQFRTTGAPLQASSFSVQATRADTGAAISATSNSSGEVTGDVVDGEIITSTGIATLRFGELVNVSSLTSDDLASWWYDAENIVAGQIFKPLMILPETAKYSAVVTSSLPLDADILGLDPVRLPIDGRVPVFRRSGQVVVHHTKISAPMAVSNGQTVDLGRERISSLRVIGADGTRIFSGYSQDLDAGTVTFSNVAGYSQPVTIEDRIEDMRLVTDVQINGVLRLSQPLSHDFPSGSYVSSALIIDDLFAHVAEFFDQQTWSNAWQDVLSGNQAGGTYNKALFPIEVSNKGAIQERWAIVFTNTTTVQVIGETVGVIATGHSISEDLAPINPAQGVPYFSLAAAGWGAGWAAGNVLRFNTVAAHYPIWCARTVLQGDASVDTDGFTIAVRGDIDNQ